MLNFHKYIIVKEFLFRISIHQFKYISQFLRNNFTWNRMKFTFLNRNSLTDNYHIYFF